MSRLPVLIVRLAARLLPADCREWGRAMIAETAALEYAPALRFASGCLWAAIRIRLSVRSPRKGHDMVGYLADRPRRFAVLCAATAILLGFAYLAAAGAPARYLLINVAAFMLGLVALAAMSGARLGTAVIGFFAVAAAGILLTVSLTGVSADGITRWVRVGGMLIQPSLILVPVLLLGFVRLRSRLLALTLGIAAIALALAPDRAMAGALVAGLAIVAASRRGWLEFATLAAASGALAVTLIRPDPSPAVAYVDQIPFSAFDVHAAAGLAVWGGILALMFPAVVGMLHDPANRLFYAVFGTIWLAVVGAAALGNFPTPVVGYGGSAILGYLIAIIGLPPRHAAEGLGDEQLSPQQECEGSSLRLGLA